MPLPQNLTGDLTGKQFSFDARGLYIQPGIEGTMVDASCPCDLTTNGSVQLQRGSQGLWIPYQPQATTYALFEDHDWIASGPFSGCELAIGDFEGDFYVAHISIESRRYEARNAYNEWLRGSLPRYRSQITAPQQAGFYASYVFVSVAPQLEIVRMDVTTTILGGTDGMISSVTHLDVNSQTPAPSQPTPRRSPSPGCRCVVF